MLKRMVSLFLVLAMLILSMPMKCFAAETASDWNSSLAGKTISILGDSISTYTGVSDDASVNATLSGGAVYYTPGRWDIYMKDTWWQQTIDALGMELLVNNSWSGSCVLHTRRGTEGAYVDRCVQLHNDKTGEEPDIIVTFIAANDFSYYQDTLGTADIDYDMLINENTDGTYTYAEPVTTCEAFAIMLHKMINRYPDAEIYCMTPTARRSPDKEDDYADVGQPTAFNAELIRIIEHYGCTAVDLETCGIDKEAEVFDQYIADGRTHPNAEGMDLIAQALCSAMLGTEVTLYDITEKYNAVTSDNTAAAAIAGKSYVANLTVQEGYTDIRVTVTMGGKDVTDTVYSDGMICIESVTGDIVIDATAERDPLGFRWELVDDELVSTGETTNAATKLSGTVTDGVLNGARYRLETAVELKNDRPWVLEWKCAENWRGVVLSSEPATLAPGRCYLSRTKGGQLCFGTWTGTQYNNYGINLSGLDSQVHTYRLENRIAEDGSNMVWLSVDGTEIGPMQNYYIGSKDQSVTSDWLNGKDFVFSYFGSDSTLLDNCALDYIQIIECTHIYKNGVCTVCGTEHPNLVNFEGKVISILGDSISTFAGYIPVADGFNLEHLARYPQDNLLTDVNETWWMQVITELNGKLGINDSWRGATVSGAKPVTTGTTGANAAMGNLQRIRNLGANGMPDVILFYGGTNDLAHVSKVGIFDAEYAPTEADLTTTQWDNLADGYVHTLLKLQYFYPDAQIIAMLPTYTRSYYSDEKLAEGNAVLADICEHYGVTYVDLRDCGISTADLPDGIHPNAAGMDYITTAVLDALLSECDLEPGENVVHSVTHELTGAESSLGYYKGVSHGQPFVANITGENLTVTVTMGDADITDAVYADGIVYIPSVTGDIVITATGTVKAIYEDHLQPLPEPYYGVNLWEILEHDEEYFYVDEWTVHSSGKVFSVTVPVVPGEKIYASSFGAAGSNGSSMNGIRITWFGTDGVLKSMDPDEVYAEFTAKGYVVVPEGAVAVNIPMWTNDPDWELYIWDSGYEPAYSLGDRLQQLPENVCMNTNLWDVLEPVNEYYTGNEWGNLSTGQVWSVTFPVDAGDQLWANSFQKYGSNGNDYNSVHGIRVTWFGVNGVLKSMSAGDVYTEFSTNGYLSVPEGAVAVNIPMWNESDDNEIYILNREHNYENGVCTGCGDVATGAIGSMSAVLELENVVHIVIKIKHYTGFEGIDFTKDMGLLVWPADAELTDETAIFENAEDVIEGAFQVDGVYCVKTNGIAAKELGDELQMRVYVRLADGSYVYSKLVSYSAQKYAESVFTKDADNTELVALCKAMLNYGTAAQIAFNYKTSNLMNAELSAEDKVLNWDASILDAVESVDANKTVGLDRNSTVFTGRGAVLALEGAVNIQFRMGIATTYAESAQEIGILYWSADTYRAVELLTAENADLADTMVYSESVGRYVSEYPGIAPKDLGDTVYACAYLIAEDGTYYYSGVVAYSVETYITNTIKDSSTASEDTKTLVKWLGIYGDLAKEYFY